MKVDRPMLAVRHVSEANGGDTRYAIGGIALDCAAGRRVAVATDGRVILAAEAPDGAADDDELDGDGHYVDGIDGPTVIGADTVDALAKSIDKPTARYDAGQADLACENHKVAYTVQSRKGGILQGADARPDGRFPKWQDVMPWHRLRSGPAVRVTLSGRILANICKALADFYEGDPEGDTYNPVELTLGDPGCATLIRAQRTDGRALFGAIMPHTEDVCWKVSDAERAFGASD